MDLPIPPMDVLPEDRSGVQSISETVTANSKKVFFVFLFAALIVAIIGGLIFLYVMFPGAFAFFKSNKQVVAEDVELVQEAFKQGDYELAVVNAEQAAITSKEQDVDALIFLARSYVLLGSARFHEETNAEKAIAVADKILTLSPNHPEAFRIKGYAYEIMQQYDMAISFYQQAIDVSPAFALAYSQLGHVYDLMGDKDTAFEYYGKAHYLNPTLSHALINLGYIHYIDGNFSEARKMFNQVLANNPDNIEAAGASIFIGMMYLDEGNYDAAIDTLKQTVVYDDQYSTAWSVLSSAYLALLNTIPETDVAKRAMYSDLVTDAADQALELHTYETYAFVNKAILKMMVEDCAGALPMLEQARTTFVDNDITLGVLEKKDARTYIDSLTLQCNN